MSRYLTGDCTRPLGNPGHYGESGVSVGWDAFACCWMACGCWETECSAGQVETFLDALTERSKAFATFSLPIALMYGPSRGPFGVPSRIV